MHLEIKLHVDPSIMSSTNGTNKVPAYKTIIENLQVELRTRQSKYGIHHPRVAESLNSIALVNHHMMKNSQGALEYHMQAERIIRSVYNNGDASSNGHDRKQLSIDLAITINDIGNVHWKLRNKEKAEACFIEALTIMKNEDISESHPRVYSLCNRLATFYRNTGICPKRGIPYLSPTTLSNCATAHITPSSSPELSPRADFPKDREINSLPGMDESYREERSSSIFSTQPPRKRPRSTSYCAQGNKPREQDSQI